MFIPLLVHAVWVLYVSGSTCRVLDTVQGQLHRTVIKGGDKVAVLWAANRFGFPTRYLVGVVGGWPVVVILAL